MDTDIAAFEIQRMNKLQKLAALLIILGPDSAAQILKNLSEQEVESVAFEMSKLTSISQELQREVLREFTEVAVQASTAIVGGTSYTKTALEKSVGLFRASEIISRVRPGPRRFPPCNRSWTRCPAAGELAQVEQPQTIALIASYLTPEKIPSSSCDCVTICGTRWWSDWPPWPPPRSKSWKNWSRCFPRASA